MMKMLREGAGALLLVAVFAVLLGAASARPTDLDVLVEVGAIIVPLGVEHRFEDVRGALPHPGELPVADPHDKKHDVHTYCYTYRTPGRAVRLEFFDSDFGVHTARISSIPTTNDAHCTALRSEPVFIVAGSRYGLEAHPSEAPPGFRSEKTSEGIRLVREWTYKDSSRLHLWGTCFRREISVAFETAGQTVRAITVMNWEEPDGPEVCP